MATALSFYYPDGSPIDFEIEKGQLFDVYKGEYAGGVDGADYKWPSTWENAVTKSRRFGWGAWYAVSYDCTCVVVRTRVTVFVHEEFR